ncbi:MAG: 30S ribosomal protein S6 [Bacilli bacterium]|nr:30S ribosomal protein S6 [Bacilli bacterium]
MKKYETMFILNVNLDEEARKNLLESLLTTLKDNGANITDVNEWGVRDFAYEINKQTKGYYVVVNFETENSNLNAEFTRVCNINENVVRNIVIALD